MIRCLPQNGCMPQNKRRFGEFSSLPTARRQEPGESDGQATTAMFSEMSPEERLKLEYEVHGVADLEEESPDLLAMKTEEMNQALARFVRSPHNRIDTSAYEKAVEMSKDYVDGLKAPLLRADRFQSREAATRLIKFLDRKRELFGEDKLVREIQIRDFEEEDMETFRKGAAILLPQKDRAGRAVIVLNGHVHQTCSNKTMMRIYFYVTSVAMRDVEGAQKPGIVVIYYGHGQTKTVKGRPKEWVRSWWAMPIRAVACHYCGNGKVLPPAIRQFFALAEHLFVCRLRVHFGPQVECYYKLMTFGIPVNETMPITADGFIDLKYHNEMMSTWSNMEAEEVASNALLTAEIKPHEIVTSAETPLPATTGQYVIPGTMDILLGKGRSPMSRPGALRLHDLVHEHREEYEAATKQAKPGITIKILDTLKASGCRFLKSTPGGYEVCGDAVAKEKISKVFRNLRLKDTGKTSTAKRQNAKLKQQNVSSK